MTKYPIILFAVFISGMLRAQPHSDSTYAAYREYIAQHVDEIVLSAITDSIVVEEDAIFPDYMVKEITDTSLTINLDRKKQIIVSRKASGWVLQGYRENKKDGLWIFCRPNGILIER